jgi:hypothetical protein
MKDLFGRALVPVYIAGGPVTFSYLTFFDGYEYNSWNWIIVIPLNLILSGIWPIYWGILQWIPGLG